MGPKKAPGKNLVWVLARTVNGRTDYGVFGFGSNSPTQVVDRINEGRPAGDAEVRENRDRLRPVAARKKSSFFQRGVAEGWNRFFTRESHAWGSQVASMRPAKDDSTTKNVRGTVSWLTQNDLYQKLDVAEAAAARIKGERKYQREVVTTKVAYWQ